MTPFLDHVGELTVENESFHCDKKGLEYGSIFFGRLINNLAYWMLTKKRFRVVIEHNPEPGGRTNVSYEFTD